MLDYCVNNVQGIIFKFISKAKMEEVRRELLERFNQGGTIPGTRSFHFFSPISSTSVGYKKLCEDDSFYGTFSFADNQEAIQNIQPKEMDYIACRYDNFWWIGLVDEINHEEEDFEVKFMHPHGPTRNFRWPQREDKCS